jgi:putative PEP-CTERM system histidine kinase
MIAIATEWGHALAAFLFAALVAWQATLPQGNFRRLMLTMACAATALWCGVAAVAGPASVAAEVAMNAADLGWLGFMLALQAPGREDRRRVLILGLYGVLGLVLLTGIALQMLPVLYAGSPRIQQGFLLSSLTLRLAAATGALVLVHNLFTAASAEARWGIGTPMFALAVMWSFDLNLATVSYLMDQWPVELFAVRGFVLALLAPLLVTVSRFTDVGPVRPSRSARFQTLPLIAVGAYLALMVLLSKVLHLTGNLYLLGDITVALGFSSLALLLFPSTRMRTRLKRTLARHLFQHRYDYRVEWRRFTDTLGRPGEGAVPLTERMVQAIADIPESPGGLLLLTADDGGLDIFARRGWTMLEAPPQRAGSKVLADYLQQSGDIIELDPVRLGEASIPADTIPDWMMAEERAWAIVPLLHFDRLVGAVLLEQPEVSRRLDWEDHDLLRVAGRQVASYLAEARGQEALSDARRFDEFNRRFAFIMHDIKNLVSQLSLLARNAERHADNPAFRADMIATLQSSVGKMNDLLARLSQHHRSRPEPPKRHALKPLVERIVAQKTAHHAVTVEGRSDVMAMVDPGRLEQALGHLVQNAIDASAPDSPVYVRITQRGLEAVIEIIDKGCGMSAEFVRSRLFHAFSSTKEGGFGIGAFEARSLVAAMNGRVEVRSREGEGSRFSIILPIASALGRPTMQAAQ